MILGTRMFLSILKSEWTKAHELLLQRAMVLNTYVVVTYSKTSLHPENAMKIDISQCNCTAALLN